MLVNTRIKRGFGPPNTLLRTPHPPRWGEALQNLNLAKTPVQTWELRVAARLSLFTA